MKKVVRTVAITLVFLTLTNLLPQTVHVTKAAGFMPVQLNVESFLDGTVRINWTLPGVKSVRLKYHAPDDSGAVTEVNRAVFPEEGQSSIDHVDITGIRPDYIYDFEIWFYNNSTALPDDGNSPAVTGKGLVYFISDMTFYVNRVDEQAEQIPGGGYEIGTKPRLNLRWVMPKAYSQALGEFRDASLVMDEIKSRLSGIYGDSVPDLALDFLVSISQDIDNPYTGTYVNITQQQDGYTAGASFEGIPVSAKVNTTDAPGDNRYLSFTLAGRKDASVTDPSEIELESESELPHMDIFPGTLYYIYLKPTLRGAIDALRTAPQHERRGFPVDSDKDYVYTYIRFQLTKDEADNVTVTVFRLNRGSTYLPGMYYSIQSSYTPSDAESAWTEQRQLRDINFVGDRAITNITDINPNNLMYYRIVVLDDNRNVCATSQKLAYAPGADLSRPPVPKNIAPGTVNLVTGTVNGNYIKSGEVEITWEKPSNWTELKQNNYYIHFMLNTFQTEMKTDPLPELEADGVKYGRFELKYRYVKSISAASPSIKEKNGRLSLVLNRYLGDAEGFDLFNREDADGSLHQLSDAMQPEPDYPRFLLPNTTYYLQMYTTTEAARDLPYDPASPAMSNKSLTVSFTTPVETTREVPIPKNFFVSENGVDAAGRNYIELQFDKVEINWSSYTSDENAQKAVHYDLYMNTVNREDVPFVLIGSTEAAGDVLFTGADDIQLNYIKARIDTFSEASQAYTEFGGFIKPNTTYYFKLKVRLVIEGREDVESVFTAVVPVTTLREPVEIPGDSTVRPLAPVDFAIAKDEKGVERRTGSSAAFNWTRLESDVSYELVVTSTKISPEAEKSEFMNDPVYIDFVQNYVRVYHGGDTLLINPKNRVNEICEFEIDRWLFPNKLYYFSLRAVRPSGLASVWITVPVTTLLIDGPQMLAALTDIQIAFTWFYSGINTRADDFTVWLRGPEDPGFRQLGKSEYRIVKDGFYYYGRVLRLNPNSAYQVKVFKDGLEIPLISPVDGRRTTRDDRHQVEVQWKGLPDYAYEIAIRAENEDDYTVLTSVDFELYTEETNSTLADSSLTYSARIKSREVVLQGGARSHLPLKSNTKYYIRVRAVKTWRGETVYSKYAGPVETRTEFNQKDYDDEERDRRIEESFMDAIKAIERRLYWDVSYGPHARTILLKPDKVSGFIENDGDRRFIIDLSASAAGSADVVLVPSDLARTLSSTDTELVIRARGSEYTLRGGIADIDNSVEIKTVLADPGVRYLYLGIEITRNSLDISGITKGHTQVSTLNDIKIAARGSSMSYGELKDKIHDRLYNKSTGLAATGLKKYRSIIQAYELDDMEELEDYLDEIVFEIEKNLGKFIEDTLAATAKAESSINRLKAPMTAALYMDRSVPGLVYPYVNYNGSGWIALNGVVPDGSVCAFKMEKPGRHVLMAPVIDENYIPSDFPGAGLVAKYMSIVDLKAVFPGSGFQPYKPVSVLEAVLLYEATVGRSPGTGDESFRQKTERLGLTQAIGTSLPSNSISRQQFAALAAKACEAKLGINPDEYRAKKTFNINDLNDINRALIKPVILCLDLGLMEPDDGLFRPNGNVARGEAVVSLAKLLELAGEL